MKRILICRRCHHVRDVNYARLCQACQKILDEMGRPKTPPPALPPNDDPPTIDEGEDQGKRG